MYKRQVKTIAKKVDGSDVIPTVINLWKVADLLEREVFDFVGIKFLGHPCLLYTSRATGDKEALDIAISLYHDIEKHAFDAKNNGFHSRVNASIYPLFLA